MALAQIFFVSCAVLLTGASVLAQDTSSKPSSSSASAPSETVNNAGPGAALKGVLSAACSQNQITLGLLRENGEWKLLSLGLLLLDLPSLEVEWDAAEVEQTEKSALETLNKVAGAVEAYRNKYAHLPESLARLGPPLHGAANGEAAGLLDSDLANGMKNGYTVRYVIVGASTLGAPAKYELAATPLQYGRTGRRPFFRDSNGAMHAADRHGAVGSETDPKVE